MSGPRIQVPRIQVPLAQRGTAVIIAMLVLALAVAAAAAMLERQDLDARALQSQRDYEQARWMLRGGMHWARSILAEDARAGASDHRRELWASGLPPTDVQLGSLAGEIRDEQGLFNLNNLLRGGKPDPLQISALGRLLGAIGLAPALADAIAARIDPKRPLADVGELAGLGGHDADALSRLRRYATALPRPTAVNINTAPAEVLAAVVEGLALPEAQALARRLATDPVRNRDEFQARLRPNLRPNLEGISASSQFFVVQGRAKVGDADLRMEALLQRTGTGLPVIVWQRSA
jgi:general secretion pathway protein K